VPVALPAAATFAFFHRCMEELGCIYYAATVPVCGFSERSRKGGWINKTSDWNI